MKSGWIRPAFSCALVCAALACGKKEPPQPSKSAKTEAGKPGQSAAENPLPYAYPAPVKGHYDEVNVGSFDVVDGIAYKSGRGTVVFVTSKPIASPMLAGSPCPMTEARSLLALRDAAFLEVTLDSSGRSKYFAAGKAFGGSSREEEVGSRSWSSKLKANAGRASGSVQTKRHGDFEFDLPVSTPSLPQVGQGEWVQGKRTIASEPRPSEPAATAAYRAAQHAALKKDWKALLAALGFEEKTSAAIRGLSGIEEDLAVFADRFLLPGDPGDFTAQPGKSYVRAEGTNSKGKKFANFYHFAPCGDRLILVSIAENPQ